MMRRPLDDFSEVVISAPGPPMFPSAEQYEASLFRYLLSSPDTSVKSWFELPWEHRIALAQAEREIDADWLDSCRAAFYGGPVLS